MAKFRSSSVVEPINSAESVEEDASEGVLDRSIGSIISELRDLSTDQVVQILAYQQQHGVRFGEAAVALGLVSNDDVLQALKLPSLGVMPKPGTRRSGPQRLLGMEQRVLGNNMAPSKGAA